MFDSYESIDKVGKFDSYRIQYNMVCLIVTKALIRSANLIVIEFNKYGKFDSYRVQKSIDKCALAIELKAKILELTGGY